MVKEIVTEIALCLALGATLTALLLWIIYKQICKRENSLSEYYFKLPCKPIEPKTTVVDILFELSLFAFILSICFIIVFSFVWRYIQNSNVCPSTFLAAIKAAQGALNILFPPAVAIVAIFATFNRPYYILFSTHDVIKRNRIYSLTLIAIIAWCLSIALQVVVYFHFLIAKIAFIVIISAIFLFQIICFLLCLIVIINSFRIYLSGQKSELKILDTLYYNVSVAKSHLCHMDPNSAENLDAINDYNDYLIRELRQKTKKAKRPLTKYTKLSHVDFWDATSRPPFPRKLQVFKEIFCLSMWIIPFGLFAMEMLWILCSMGKISIFPLKHTLIVFILSVIVFGIVVFLFCNTPAFCQMRRALVYGRWGYRFLDQNGCPQKYIPRYPMWSTKITKWVRALLNLITLCRIECANGCHQKLLENLYDTLSEMDDHDNIGQFTFVLALCLCARFAAEAKSNSQAAVEIKIKEMREVVMRDLPQGELINSWAEAIWIDIHRDMEWCQKIAGNYFCPVHNKPISRHRSYPIRSPRWGLNFPLRFKSCLTPPPDIF